METFDIDLTPRTDQLSLSQIGAFKPRIVNNRTVEDHGTQIRALEIRPGQVCPIEAGSEQLGALQMKSSPATPRFAFPSMPRASRIGTQRRWSA